MGSSGRDGTEPQLWVNQAAESHERVGSRLSPMLPGLAVTVPGPKSHLLGAAGQGKAGRG